MHVRQKPRPSDDYDLVFHQWFSFDLRCSDGASDNSKLGMMRSKQLHGARSGSQLQRDAYCWVRASKVGNDLGQKVCAGEPGRDDR